MPNKKTVNEVEKNQEFLAQGRRLSELRKQKGLTAEQLAKQMTQAGAKVSRGAISNWERGTNGIVAAKLPVLADILGCTVGFLLHGQPQTTQIHQIEVPQKINNASNASVTEPSISTTTSTLPISTQQPVKTLAQTIQPEVNHMKPLTTPELKKSDKLKNVCYDIRGPLLKTANEMEAKGHRIIKLNVGNPAPFKLNAPQEILQDVALNLHHATGYSDSQGIFSARKSILQYYQSKGLLSAVNVRDVYLGNGVSELIVMSMQAMLNDGDEVLIPMPDYPLWTAATNLAGGKAVHYRCDEDNDWQPSIEDIKAKITERTRGIVVINPNNPTGSLYSDEMLKQIIAIAKAHNLVIMADEIYDRVLYDGATHTPMCTLTDDVLVLSFNGLSKSHRIAGFRAGWMMLSGKKDHATDFIEGLDMLASMRLCANVPAQYTIQTAMGGYQSMQALTNESGRLFKQRQMAVERLNNIKGISCTMPKGAFYCFPKIDLNVYPITDDTDLMMQLLKQQKVLMVQGTGFNWDSPDHFRVVFLPNLHDLDDAMNRLDKFFAKKRQQFGTA